jgi:carbon monoxide dehydrogenase subunit G
MRNSTILIVLLLAAASLCAQQIPPGTLLPAMLDNTLDSARSKPGQAITAKVMQDVPLADSGKIKRESKILGHVVAVSADNVSVQFDQIDLDKHLVPVNLALRALASMQAVAAARQPVNADSGIGTTGWDANLIQVGGQVAFNGQRIVKSRTGQLVGRVIEPGAILGVPMANPERGCGGAGSNSDQAFWVFSTDACGVYGEKDLSIGTGATLGQIVLKSPKKFTIRGGSGWLFQVN